MIEFKEKEDPKSFLTSSYSLLLYRHSLFCFFFKFCSFNLFRDLLKEYHGNCLFLLQTYASHSTLCALFNCFIFKCRLPPQGFWVTVLCMEYMHLSGTCTSLEKLQGLVGLGLDQEEEPAVVDENTAYLHCGEDLCWICLWELLVVNVWGGGCIAEHWWHSLSVGAFLCSVSIWYHCWMAGIKWNSRSRLRQNTSLNLNFYLPAVQWKYSFCLRIFTLKS